MEIELRTTVKVNAAFLEVSAEVRYWDDATVNGVEDTDGKIPLRSGANWEPVIDLHTGKVKDWPAGVTADVHYKVCDQGEYWLQDADGKRVAKHKSYYVPNDLLCIGDNGYGDYIILEIDETGQIKDWKLPQIDPEEWEAL